MSYQDQDLKRRFQAAADMAAPLFHRVLIEGPRADEFYFVSSKNRLHVLSGCGTPRYIRGRWYCAHYAPDKRGYQRPDEYERENPIPGSIWQRSTWHISLAPQSAAGHWGVKVYNPRQYPVNHAFVMSDDPAEFDRRTVEREEFTSPDAQEWHRYEMADELVAAAIRCIKGQSI
jgi:hypothetical protein